MADGAKTKVLKSELSGDIKLYICTLTPSSASDAITFVAATDKFRTIYAALPQIESGYDAACSLVFASFSGLVVTIVTKKADAVTAADDWTGVVIRLLLVVGSN